MGGLVIGLTGTLGAGKTMLVKGLARGNAASDATEVTSPTFTLVNEYRGRLELFHLDAYRLRNSDQMLALGFDEMITDSSVVIVEWADRVPEAVPDECLAITLTSTGPTGRELSMTAHGQPAREVLAALERRLG